MVLENFCICTQAGPAVMRHGRNVVLLFFLDTVFVISSQSTVLVASIGRRKTRPQKSIRLGKRPTVATSTLKRVLVQWNLKVHWKCLKHQYYLN